MSDDAGRDAGVQSTVAASITGGNQTVNGVDSVMGQRPFADWPAEYTYVASLPRTGQGQVFRARRVDGLEVAIKQVPLDETRELIESHTLQTISSAGIARFVEERQTQSARLLITEWIDGSPFPGDATPMAWAALAPILHDLLERLGEVHAHGYIHRDLKPGNVLVRDGQVVILDFGLAWAVDGPGITRPGSAMGTPIYLAPEQLDNSDMPRPATDLWAVGVMAYQALTGQTPFSSRAWRARRIHRAPRLAERAGLDAPPHVLRSLDALLNMRAEERPQSAAAVISALNSSDGVVRARWVGSTAVIDACVAAASRGASASVIAAPGVGGSRTLAEVEHRLRSAGFTIARCDAGSSTLDFGSVIPSPPRHSALDAATRWTFARLRAWLRADRHVLLVDDWETLNPVNQTVVIAARQAGAVIDVRRSGEGEVVCGAAPADLEALFADPERVLRIPSRAAAWLHRNTGGRMRLINARLSDWQQHGVITPAGDRWTMRSAKLAELPFIAPITVLPGHPGANADVLAWLTLGEGALEDAQLAEVMQRPVWSVQAALEDLCQQHRAFRQAGRAVALSSGDLLRWRPAQRSAAHLAIARTLTTEADTARHRWLANPSAAVPHLLALAERALTTGRIETARGVCDVLLRYRAQRRLDMLQAELDRTLRLLARTALVDGRKRLVLTALQKFQTCGVDPNAAEMLLLQHFSTTRKGAPVVPKARFEALGAQPKDLERFRIHALMELADRDKALLEHRAPIEALAKAMGGGMLDEVQARLAYRSNDFEFAEQAYLRAAKAWGDVEAKAAALSRAASSAMEAFAPDRAQAHLQAAQAMSASFEHPHLAARLAWLERAISHRLRVPSETDTALLAAMERLDLPKLMSLVLVAECGLTWQRGDLVAARKLACQAEALFAVGGRQEQVDLMLAMRVATGDRSIDAHNLVERAVARLDDPTRSGGQGLQIVGLAASASTQLDLSALEGLSKGLAQRDWDIPIDLLSVNEVLKLLNDQAGHNPEH